CLITGKIIAKGLIRA
ncbi:hypothetical protein pipiens_018609, partial [Culex pipiens pipiens]